ncbi:E3 SUMO-protein ligase ZBED1-like [Diabrotica undecimpunctata]|uniref:E3 SUMO-protein ligase ZBED1-like n=1 Tax=Diabrotica undecimpunctata TaxID=50387 RepID=UPI003B641665
MSLRNRTSVAWDFFVKNDDKTKAVCKLCSCEYKYIGNTTSLIDHIKKKHTVQYNEVIGQNLTSEKIENNAPEQSSRTSLMNRTDSHQNNTILTPSHIHNVRAFNEPVPKRPKQIRLTVSTKMNQKIVDDALLDMIVVDMQPLQIVENEGFKKYTNKLNPDYILPSRKKIAQMLEDKYKICSLEVKEKLQGVEYIALTTDIWSSDSQKSYISVTAHFIKDVKLHSIVISTTELSEHHTSLNIANALRTILLNWEIFDKIVTIVTDNASNMKKAVKDFLNKRNDFCVAHTLNLVVKDCISKNNENDRNSDLKNAAVLDVILKSRAIVAHFKQSIKSSNTLRDKQRQMNLDIIKLKQDVQTRWTSTYLMLDRLLRVKDPLSATLPLLDSPPSDLTSAEWLILKDCVVILQPVEKITTALSGETYPTLSCIIPLVRGLQSSLKKKTPLTEPGKHLQRSLLKNVDERLGVYEVNRTASMATILDPRFKKKAFGTDSAAEKAIKYVLDELAQFQQVHEQIPEPAVVSTSGTSAKADDDDIWEDFDKKISDTVMQQTTISSATIVLTQYLDLPYLDRKQDPLHFWKQREHIFPSLCRMAYKYLCIPATSVPSERLFSKAGLLTNQRRNRLMPKKVDELLFLNSFCTEN